MSFIAPLPMDSITIELPWPPTELSGHNNKHFWKVRPIINKHRKLAEDATRESRLTVPDEGDIRVSFTFYPPDRRSDRMNFANRVKAYADGIADALGVNDRRFLPTYHFAEPVTNARVVVTVRS